MARLLDQMAAVPDLVLSSPYRRARETAAAVVDALGRDIPMGADERLAPSAGVARARRAIQAHQVERLLVVAHEPLLSELAAALTGGAARGIDLRKGGLIEIELRQRGRPPGVLLGLLRPAHLRGLKRRR